MSFTKFMDCQDPCISHYKNLLTKIMKCCANIYFNHQCPKNEVVPKYANIKIPIRHIGMSFTKFMDCQAPCISHYKNLRTKIMKCCANIYFNRQCLKNEVVPKYANIKIPIRHIRMTSLKFRELSFSMLTDGQI